MQLEYSRQAAFQNNDTERAYASSILARIPCTTVNLRSPEESLTQFPLDPITSNRCRQAWSAGCRAAEAVGWTPIYGTLWNKAEQVDVHYAFYDKGSEPSRIKTQVGRLVEIYGFVINREIYEELESVLQRESNETLNWLQEQKPQHSGPGGISDTAVNNRSFNDYIKINAFTIFQAFIMGYYYNIFLRLADTSELQLKVVDGSWGYRSFEFLTKMQMYLAQCKCEEPGVLIMSRELVISIISMLLCNGPSLLIGQDEGGSNNGWCLGTIGKRTLLVRSLLKPCRTIQDVGQLVILDVDVSGIPRNRYGLVRPGLSDDDLGKLDEPPAEDIADKLAEDVSFHIEADWDGDPDQMLLCVRYKGRRAWTLNPATSDLTYLSCTFLPAPERQPLTDVKCVKLTALHTLNRQPVQHNDRINPYLVRLAHMPRLCYAVAACYDRRHQVRFAGDDLEGALQDNRRCRSYIIIEGDAGFIDTKNHVPFYVEGKIRNAAVLVITRQIRNSDAEARSYMSF